MFREVLFPKAVLRGTALAAPVMAIALLAGCGGDDDDASDSTVAGAESERRTEQSGGEQSGGGAGSAGDEQSGGEQSDGGEGSAEDGAGGAADFGEEAEGADRAGAGRAVQEFLRAWADGDWAGACSLLATSTKQDVELFAGQYVKSQDCTEQLEALGSKFPPKLLPQAGPIEVTDVRLEDDHGFVIYSDANGTEFAFPVVQEDSAWKVAAIVGTKQP